jgi:hypothetical protein
MLLCHIWQAQWVRHEALRTTDGRALRVIFRGHWSAGHGPDFQDALLVLDDGPLLRGAVEIHLRPGDWSAHGHDHDPAYSSVILHVTRDESAADCRRADGARVPHLALRPYLRGLLTDFAPPTTHLSLAVADHCPARLPGSSADTIPAVVRAAGQARLAHKAVVAEAGIWSLGADQAFYATIMDGLGYSQNRAPFASLAERLPLAALADHCHGLPTARLRLRLAAFLLGAAGFLPWREVGGVRLAPGFIAALEQEWTVAGQPWHAPGQPPLAW